MSGGNIFIETKTAQLLKSTFLVNETNEINLFRIFEICAKFICQNLDFLAHFGLIYNSNRKPQDFHKILHIAPV